MTKSALALALRRKLWLLIRSNSEVNCFFGNGHGMKIEGRYVKLSQLTDDQIIEQIKLYEGS